MLTRSESWEDLLKPPDMLHVPETTNLGAGHNRNPSEISHIFSHNETQLVEKLEYLEHINKSLENEVENLTMSEKSLQQRLRDAKLELEMLSERVEGEKSARKAVEIERDKQKKNTRKQKKKVQELQKKNEDIEKELRMYEELQTIRRQEFEMLQLPKSGYTSPKSMSDADEPTSPSSTKSRVNLTGSLQTFKNQVTTLEKKIEEQQKELEEKDINIRRLTNKISAFGEPQEIIHAMNLELKETKDECSTLEEELIKSRLTEESMLKEIQRYKQALADLQEDQRSARNSLSNMETEINEMKVKLEILKNECMKGECAYAAILTNIRKEKSQKLEAIKTEVNKKEQEISVSRENLDILEKKLLKCSNAAKRVKLMNSISLLHSEIMEQEMDMDVLRSSQLNFNVQLIDSDCLGCQHLESENTRIRGQRAEFQSELMNVKIQLAEAEAELR